LFRITFANEVEQIFSEQDQDENGKVDFEEFLRYGMGFALSLSQKGDGEVITEIESEVQNFDF
jgi:Ca2+-binding EF-hand superfamily protein